jgi:8-oxo-dGTP pyrophosphatase MutT (NUDIX family)
VPIPEFVVELRRRVGTLQLWMPGVTAVIRRDGVGGPEVLLVERADNGAWTPVTGIVDPGEEPGVAAAREALEETGVVVSVDRLAAVAVTDEVVYPNGDRAVYLDHAFACTWLSGEAHVADDESSAVRWCPVAELGDVEPPMSARMLARIDAALSDETATRFTS